MRCLYPRTVGFLSDGKTISWSQKTFSKEFGTFQLPCSKCIECRLEYARSWAVRCSHEAQMHESNAFITLTYSDEYLKPLLNYEDFQLFMKRLRKTTSKNVTYLVTGEYGEQRKRPHWHAIIFNWRPSDELYKYTNERGDKVYSSDTLSTLWPYGISEHGSVTFESAGYVARYAAKKLVHGRDDEHTFKPISKKSLRPAIGLTYLEKYWPDVFNYGQCRVINSSGEHQVVPIPRYYEKWLLKNVPDAWIRYVTEVKPTIIKTAEKKSKKEIQEFWNDQDKLREKYPNKVFPKPITRSEVKTKIANDRFKRLMQYLKGDINGNRQ